MIGNSDTVMDLKLCDRKVQGRENVWSQNAGPWNCDRKVQCCETVWSQSAVPCNCVIAKCSAVKLCDRKVQCCETVWSLNAGPWNCVIAKCSAVKQAGLSLLSLWDDIVPAYYFTSYLCIHMTSCMYVCVCVCVCMYICMLVSIYT